MLTKAKLPTALYGRTSKDDPRKVTIDLQKGKLRHWASVDDLVENIVAEFWDDGVSGKIPIWERKEGAKLLAALQRGTVQAVAVLYADRFGRTLLDGLNAVKELERQGAVLVSVEDGWDGRKDESPLFFQFRMMMAEEEHRRIKARMQDGKERSMQRNGTPPTGALVFGYNIDEHGGFVVNPEEASVVIQIFEKFVSGMRPSDILEWVKDSGLKPGRKYQKRQPGSEAVTIERHQSARWHISRISRILQNRTYLGERKWGKRLFTCPTLVDEQTFQTAQVMLATSKASRPTTRFNPERGLLSGLPICENCGCRFYRRDLVGKRKFKEDRRLSYYVCVSSKTGKGCNAKMIPVGDFDRDVWTLIHSYLDNPEDLIRRVLASDKTMGDSSAELVAQERSLVARIELLTEEASQVWREKEANGWPLEFVRSHLNSLTEKQRALREELERTRLQMVAMGQARVEAADVTAALAKIRAKLANGISEEEKAEVIRFLVRELRVKTVGKGKQKRAEVVVRFRWGEEEANPLDFPETCLTQPLGICPALSFHLAYPPK